MDALGSKGKHGVLGGLSVRELMQGANTPPYFFL